MFVIPLKSIKALACSIVTSGVVPQTVNNKTTINDKNSNKTDALFFVILNTPN
jgi:hypothetical protein